MECGANDDASSEGGVSFTGMQDRGLDGSPESLQTSPARASIPETAKGQSSLSPPRSPLFPTPLRNMLAKVVPKEEANPYFDQEVETEDN